MKSESDKWSSGYLNCQQVHDQINPTGTPKIEGPQEVNNILSQHIGELSKWSHSNGGQGKCIVFKGITSSWKMIVTYPINKNIYILQSGNPECLTV